MLKYTTKAAAHYRIKLSDHFRLKLVTGGSPDYFLQGAPDYNTGREQEQNLHPALGDPKNADNVNFMTQMEVPQNF